MDKVRFGVIGVGNMGTNHAIWLSDGTVRNATLTAVCDINAERLERIKEKIANPDKVSCFTNIDDLLASGTVDAIIIAVPHFLHPEFVIKALKAGVHVISEKPAGVYTKQVKEMNEVASASDKLFALMFNQRTNPLFKKMKQMIEEDAIGKINRTNWIITDWYRPQSYYDSGAWRATWAGEGGGVLFNQAPHNIDLFQWIAGMMPSKVRAHCHFGKWHDIEVEDDVTAYFEYPNGATGVFITTTGDCPGSNRFEVQGDKGKLVFDNGRLYYHKLSQSITEFSATYTGGFGQPTCEVTEITVEEPEFVQHRAVLNNFANAILGIEPLFIRGTDGINGVQLADAMLLSAWLDKEIQIPIDDELYLSELKKRMAVSRHKTTQEVTLDTTGSYGTKK